jgi:hypothetical protein
MPTFREHGLMLYLSKELYMGFIKLQAEKGLGRSYAGLLPFIEGLYKLGYISQEVYEVHKRRYSKSLTDDDTPTLEKLENKAEHDRLVKQFSDVLKQWPTMKAKAKTYWIKKAREHHATIPNAKLILELAQTKVAS